jgi:hypothetical protein
MQTPLFQLDLREHQNIVLRLRMIVSHSPEKRLDLA